MKVTLQHKRAGGLRTAGGRSFGSKQNCVTSIQERFTFDSELKHFQILPAIQLENGEWIMWEGNTNAHKQSNGEYAVVKTKFLFGDVKGKNAAFMFIEDGKTDPFHIEYKF